MSTVRELLKIPSPSKTINIRALNRLGLQLGRTAVAHSLYRMRASNRDQQLERLYRDGVVTIEDFLPQDEYHRVRSQALAALDSEVPRVVHDHGASRVEQLKSRELTGDHYSALQSFFGNARIRELFSGAERCAMDFQDATCVVERLRVHNAEGEDRESSLHSDTFFNTHKCWLYLSDIGESDSAFVYVAGSHRVDRKRLTAIYRESVRENQGSRRIHRAELDASGLREQIYRVRQNTFVMANTFGFHRRVQGERGSERLALHISVRNNPFLRPGQYSSRLTAFAKRISP